MRAVLVLLLLATFARAQSIEEFVDKRVGQVKVVLDKRVRQVETPEQRELLAIINISSGEVFSSDKIREAVLRLYRLGKASSVKVSAGLENGAVTLIFEVDRQLLVRRVEFDIPFPVDENELRARVYNLGQGAILRSNHINKTADALSELFKDLGYFQVEVESEITVEPDPRYGVVTFHVRPGAQAIVERLELRASPSLNLSKLLPKLRTAPGQPFSSRVLQQDIDLIRQQLLGADYLSSSISQPTLSYDSASNRVTVTVEIEAGPRVSVEVKGFDIDSRQLRTKLAIFSGSGIDDFAIEESRRKLTEELQLQGYFFAEVSASVVRDTESVRLIYEVEKGQRYRVSSINLLGARAVNYELLAGKLSSQRSSTFGRGITSTDYLKRDADTIVYVLRSLGYAKARVTGTRLGITPNNENLIINFVVDEGPRTQVAALVLEGNRVFTSDTLLAALPHSDYLTSAYLGQVEDALRSFYDERGYAEAIIETKVEQIDDERARVRLTVDEGEQILIGSLVITNQGRSSAKTISKYLTFGEGEPLRLEQLRRSEQSLYSTGAFRRVNIRHEYQGRNSAGQTLHTVFVNTEEARHYTLVYGFGYQTEDSIRGLFQISDSNFLGKLQTATLTLRGSRREQLAQFSYQFRRPFDLPISPFAILFYRKRREAGFTSDRMTAILQFERQLNDRNELIFRYSFENVRTDNFNAVQLDRQDRSVRLGRFSSTYLRDTRDNIVDAERGIFVTGDLSIAASALGSNRSYLRLFALHQMYRKISDKPRVVLATNTQLGLATTFDGRVRIPISERFFAGGANSLRGFGFERAGPIRAATGLPTGGNALFIFTSELRFQLLGPVGAAAFYDTGNAFRTFSDLSPRKFSNSIGSGLRLKTPLGPIRLDVGVLLNRRPNPLLPPEPRVRVHFNFGQAF